MVNKLSVIGTVTEHLLVWDGEDSGLPEWTAGLELEDEGEEIASTCNTRKDR